MLIKQCVLELVRTWIPSFVCIPKLYSIVNINLQLTTSGNNTAGEKYTLVCAMSVVTGTTFQWLRSNMTIVTNANITMINSSVSYLVIDPLKASHEGSVTCQLEFEGTTYEESVYVSVNGEPLYIEL